MEATTNFSSKMNRQGAFTTTPHPPPRALSLCFCFSVVRVDIEGLVHGNFSDADAESVLDDIEQVPICACVSRTTGRPKLTGRNRR